MTLSETDFTPVDSRDIPLLIHFLHKANYEESNHNIVNMFQWRSQYPLWKYSTEDYCLLLGVHKGHLFCYMPLCEKPYFKEAILKAQSIFNQYNIPFELSCFTTEMKDYLLEILPNFHGIAEAEAADYVYLGEKLRTLSGKKLQKKRNSYNTFINDYGEFYTSEAITRENIIEIEQYLDSWGLNKEHEYAQYEKEGVKDVLAHFGLLPYNGLLIRIRGEVKAFIIGSMTSDRMVQINIEKADPTIRGLYQAIEKDFLNQFYPNIELVNREDDMGIESLRKSKLALDPITMIEKYRIKAQ